MQTYHFRFHFPYPSQNASHRRVTKTDLPSTFPHVSVAERLVLWRTSSGLKVLNDPTSQSLWTSPWIRSRVSNHPEHSYQNNFLVSQQDLLANAASTPSRFGSYCS